MSCLCSTVFRWEDWKLFAMDVNGGPWNHEELVCTNSDFVHKWEVNAPSWYYCHMGFCTIDVHNEYKVQLE